MRWKSAVHVRPESVFIFAGIRKGCRATGIPIATQQLRWLLAGFNLNAMRGHGSVHYQRAS
jgi:sorbitol-specific phosphotransferase system component IIC